MIVQGGDGEAVFQGCTHGSVDLVLEQHDVAHDHGLGPLTVLERGPGREPSEGIHDLTVNRDRHIRAWLSNLEGTVGFVVCPLKTYDSFNLLHIELARLSSERSRRDTHDQQDTHR